MKEELVDKIAVKALAYLENTEMFLKEQIPDYLQQVVKYYTVQAYASSALCILGFIASAIWLYKAIKHKPDNFMDESRFFGIMFSSIFLSIFFAFSCCNVNSALKITYAPKVFLVEYLRGKE